MNVPDRGGVNAATNVSPAATSGVVADDVPPKPGTPSATT
jgi:hypothetical protein